MLRSDAVVSDCNVFRVTVVCLSSSLTDIIFLIKPVTVVSGFTVDRNACIR